jgi:hypothetical protein
LEEVLQFLEADEAVVSSVKEVLQVLEAAKAVTMIR